MQTFNEKVSKYFTIVLLTIAITSLVFWLPNDVKKGFAAFTAVLIVACPCALALSTPFTMSAVLSIFDKNLFYLKNVAVVEQLAHINTIVFDKTGTITSDEGNNVKFEGMLSGEQAALVFSACVNSIHPLSRLICRFLGEVKRLPVSDYKEISGKGILTRIDGHGLRLGSRKFVFDHPDQAVSSTRVYIMIDEIYLGYFAFAHHYRDGMGKIGELERRYKLYLLSGDQDHEQADLERFFPGAGEMRFKQSPQDKLEFVQSLQQNKAKVMMIGDGLNDSGALKQSDLGIAITDNVNNFSPGSDAILDGRSFARLPIFLRFSKDAVKIIHFSFLISLTYNLAGLTYAVTGNLSPLVAAILMPLSTVTIISFTTIATHLAAKKRKLI